MKAQLHIWKQTFAVPSVEERHVDDCGLLLFPLQHIAVLRPVTVLQDRVIYLGERLFHLGRIVSGKSQSLITKQQLNTVSDAALSTMWASNNTRGIVAALFVSLTLKLSNKAHLKQNFEVLISALMVNKFFKDCQ